MKTQLLTSTLFAFLAGTCSATIIAQDDFSDDGPLIQSPPGIGFPDIGTAWIAHSGSGNKPIQIVDGAATIVQSSGSGEDVSVIFEGGAIGPGDTIYAGFDLAVSGSGSVQEAYFAHFKTSGNFFNSRLWVTAGSSGDYSLALSGDSSISDADGESFWGDDLTFGETYRVVISYDYDTGGKSLWVDPANMSSTSISAIDAVFSDEMSAFALRQNTGGNSTQSIDNLIVATTFAEAAVPEPTSLALLGLGTLMLARRRH